MSRVTRQVSAATPVRPRGSGRPSAGEDEAEPVGAVAQLRRGRRKRDAAVRPDDDDRERATRRSREIARGDVVRLHRRRRRSTTIRSPGRSPATAPATRPRSRRRSSSPCPTDGHEEPREEDEREEDVRRRPGRDRERRASTSARASRRRGRARRRGRRAPLAPTRRACGESSRLGDELAEHAERVARGVVVARGQRVAEPAGRAAERRRLLECAAEARVDVDRRRAVHARDLHEAAERDRPDPVLDPVPGRLEDAPAGSRCRSAAGASRARARR